MARMDKDRRKERIHIIFVVPSILGGYSNELGICSLSACLKRAGFNHISPCSPRFSRLKSLIKPGEFTFIAFSTNSVYARAYLRLARVLKGAFPGVVTLFGGPHPTAAPEMIYCDGVDALCRGYAEESFVEFLEKYDYAKGKAAADVPGWWIKSDNGTVTKNTMPHPLEDIDSLPFPDRRFIQINALCFHFARGCVHDCSFCSMPGLRALYGKGGKGYYRLPSAERCVAEIKDAVDRFGRGTISIHDSIFGFNRQWLAEFVPLYKREIGLPFMCNSSVTNVDKEYLAALEEAGCSQVCLGFETADEGVRRDVLRKRFTNSDFISAVEVIRSHGMRAAVYVMIGLPGRGIEDDLNSVVFLARVKLEDCYIQIFSYFPGTELYEKYKDHFPRSAQGYRWSSHVFSPVLNSVSLRRDLVLLYRLQAIGNLCTYLHIPRLGIKVSILDIPRQVLRVLVSLPIFHICNIVTALLIQYSLKVSGRRYVGLTPSTKKRR